MGSKSGPSGVPTVTMTKSLSATAPKSVVARSRPTRTLSGHELAKPRLGHGGLAQVDLVDDVLSHVDPRDGPAAIGQHGTDHGADVAEAHHGDPRPHAAHQEVDLSVAASENAFSHRGTQPFNPPCALCELKAAASHPR